MPKVFITDKIPHNGIQILKDKGFMVDIQPDSENTDEGKLKSIFSEYDAVITMATTKVSKAIISSASKNLKIISNFGVGFDNINLDAAKQKGITVTNTPGVASESVAEHTFAMIFALNKQLSVADKYVRQGKFKQWDPNAFLSHQLWGQTIGIIGLGRIGTFVGQIAHGGFRMEVLYFDILRSEDFELLTEAKYQELDRILKDSDIISLHVPLTKHTKGLISTREFKLMKKSAILINTSRGPVVDESALIKALKDKEIAAAGLDVYEREPNISSELFDMQNVLLTPHTASATIETREKMSQIAAQNIIDVFEGNEPLGIIEY